MEELTHKQMQKMILFSCERINGDKEEINKINVFPVPDQDTGTNLAETLNGVKEVLLNKEFSNFEELGETALEGALIAAQGNTGIIYTGFLVGFFDGIKAEPKLNTKDLAIAFEQGFKRAKDSIQNPKKGTILDVMEAFSLEFSLASEKSKNIVKNFEKALKKAHKALLETKERMPLLKKADVVDAGGLGFLMILETYYDTLVESDMVFAKKPRKKLIVTKRLVQILSNRYEVVALMRDISLSEGEMYKKLEDLGDCLDIIMVKNRVKIHIHTDDPYIVRDIIRTFGEEEAMRIEDMAREIVGEESVIKNKIGIVIDESSGLNEKNIQYYKIESIPYKIDWNGIDKLKGDTIAKKLKLAKEKGFDFMPEVSEIDPNFFKEAFEKQLKRFDSVLCITSSNTYFNAYNSAVKGREMLKKGKEKVCIYDSGSIGAGQAIVILKAIDLISEQKSIKTVLEELKALKIRNVGVINAPFIKKHSKKLKKTIVKNRYVLIQANKEFTLKETLREEECVERIIRRIRKDLKSNKKSLAVIMHNDNLAKARELKDKLKPLNTLVSFINFVDPVMSLKMGYKGLMISYIKL